MLQGSRSDMFGLIKEFVSFFAFLYMSVYIVYLFMVIYPIDFLYGYYRHDLFPGPFVDDRWSAWWVFLILGNLRILVPISLVWCFHDILSFFKRDSTFNVIRAVFVLDLLTLLIQFIMWCGFCNNGNFRNALCNDKDLDRYCKAFWKLQPDVCLPDSDPPDLVQADLTFHPSFTYWWRFTLAFTIIDFILCLGMLKIVLYVLRDLSRTYQTSPASYGTQRTFYPLEDSDSFDEEEKNDNDDNDEDDDDDDGGRPDDKGVKEDEKEEETGVTADINQKEIESSGASRRKLNGIATSDRITPGDQFKSFKDELAKK